MGSGQRADRPSPAQVCQVGSGQRADRPTPDSLETQGHSLHWCWRHFHSNRFNRWVYLSTKRISHTRQKPLVLSRHGYSGTAPVCGLTSTSYHFRFDNYIKLKSFLINNHDTLGETEIRLRWTRTGLST